MRTLLAVAAVLLLAACGSASGSGAAPSPTPPTTPAAGWNVLVTDHDRAVAVLAGQKIEVALSQRQGMTPWSGVRATDETVLAPTPTGISAPRGLTIGGFTATHPGVTTITATAGPLCSPGQACPMYAVLWSVTVTVT